MQRAPGLATCQTRRPPAHDLPPARAGSPLSLGAPQLNLSIRNPSTKRVLLALDGENSFTPRTPAFTGGQVVVRGRSNALIANRASGVQWAAAQAENLLVLPKQSEWATLKQV